jgi:hypothetical protein
MLVALQLGLLSSGCGLVLCFYNPLKEESMGVALSLLW